MRGREKGSILGAHWPLLVVLALAAVLRATIGAAYWPTLLQSDSFTYVRMAHRGDPVAIDPGRPSGYALIVDLFSRIDGSLAAITVAQHLAGLAVGVLVYVLLWRLGVPRWAATLTAAVVLASAQLATLDQYVLAETFFVLFVVSSAFFACTRGSGVGAVAASGILLASAAMLRTAGLFLIPAWLVYILWRHRALRPVAAGVLALALPLLAYSGVHAAETGRFGMTQSDGWFLYGRVAPFASCSVMRVPEGTGELCEERPQTESAAFYVWDPDSPARSFGDMYDEDLERRHESNRLLRAFALEAIRAEPLSYARVVGRDFLLFFLPAPTAGMPAQGRLPAPGSHEYGEPKEEELEYYTEIQREHVPGYPDHSRTDGVAKQAALGAQRWLWTPAWVAAAALLAALAAFVVALRRRKEVGNVPELALLVGGPLLLLVGTAATAEYEDRYLTSVLPVLISGGALALLGLYRAAPGQPARRGRRARAWRSGPSGAPR